MEKASRRLYAWLALFALTGLTLSLILTAFNIDYVAVSDQTLFHQNTGPIRIVGFFSYFTIWSNLLVVYIGWAIARNKSSTKLFGTLFATTLIMITITGLVYNTVLLPAYPPKGWYWLTSTLMHLVAPVMFVYLWLKKGPRGNIKLNRLLQTLTIPIIYLIYTVTHGLAVKQWPYKFLDLTSSGVVLWLISVTLIFGFGIFLIYSFAKLDRKPIKV
jgi:hypothetical protein